MNRPKDCLDAVASSSECTGLVPAVPWDGDSAPSRRLLRVHRQPGRTYRLAKRKRFF